MVDRLGTFSNRIYFLCVACLKDTLPRIRVMALI
jgi:hypothetical protein